MKLIYPAIFTPCTSHNGYTVEVPDLPGCVSEGKTLEEAIAMGTDAASGWVLDELEDGNRVSSCVVKYLCRKSKYKFFTRATKISFTNLL